MSRKEDKDLGAKVNLASNYDNRIWGVVVIPFALTVTTLISGSGKLGVRLLVMLFVLASTWLLCSFRRLRDRVIKRVRSKEIKFLLRNPGPSQLKMVLPMLCACSGMLGFWELDLPWENGFLVRLSSFYSSGREGCFHYAYTVVFVLQVGGAVYMCCKGRGAQKAKSKPPEKRGSVMNWLRWLSMPWPVYALVAVIVGHQVLRRILCPSKVDPVVIALTTATGAVIVIWSVLGSLSSFGRPGIKERVRAWIDSRPWQKPRAYSFIANSSPSAVEVGSASLVPPPTLEGLQARILLLEQRFEAQINAAKADARRAVQQVRAELAQTTRKIETDLVAYSEGGFGWEIFGALLILYGELAQVFFAFCQALASGR